jgi:hypothetical protein
VLLFSQRPWRWAMVSLSEFGLMFAPGARPPDIDVIRSAALIFVVLCLGGTESCIHRCEFII